MENKDNDSRNPNGATGENGDNAIGSGSSTGNQRGEIYKDNREAKIGSLSAVEKASGEEALALNANKEKQGESAELMKDAANDKDPGNGNNDIDSNKTQQPGDR